MSSLKFGSNGFMLFKNNGLYECCCDGTTGSDTCWNLNAAVSTDHRLGPRDDYIDQEICPNYTYEMPQCFTLTASMTMTYDFDYFSCSDTFCTGLTAETNNTSIECDFSMRVVIGHPSNIFNTGYNASGWYPLDSACLAVPSSVSCFDAVSIMGKLDSVALTVSSLNHPHPDSETNFSTTDITDFRNYSNSLYEWEIGNLSYPDLIPYYLFNNGVPNVIINQNPNAVLEMGYMGGGGPTSLYGMPGDILNILSILVASGCNYWNDDTYTTHSTGNALNSELEGSLSYSNIGGSFSGHWSIYSARWSSDSGTFISQKRKYKNGFFYDNEEVAYGLLGTCEVAIDWTIDNYTLNDCGTSACGGDPTCSGWG